ncbi:MAG TPA: type IV secretion system DNA-binding domain-containing protein, partial [Candidatus Paceibacterota bacterium]|nr:type IV secretion system DNA-binding domain-containing protein [Candidatus Paceibacterota bacterium]
MFNPDRVTYFAATDSRGKRIPFGLKAKDRQRHMYVIGKTGMGKSTLLENMAIQDLQNGEGLAFIDPHGSAIETLLEYIPKDRVKDVVYFAPFDMENPIAFNVMEDVGYDKRHLVVSGLMATFKKIWEDAWSARMEYILTNTLLALLEYPDATLLGVNRMYTDKAYRAKVVDNVKDPVVKDFWTKEFAGYTDRFTQEATPAIQNKIGQFTGNPLIRNIIGQPKSSFDIRELMDNNKILLINLSKGLVGDTNMRLLGSMLVTRIFLAAMSRAELNPTELKKAEQFYLYVDEFQNFANDTFSEILSEARKYSLNLIIAHQYVEQMEEQVRAAVFGNVGTTVAFRVGPFDAETLETIFTPEFLKEDLVNLGFAQVYLTLMIDGVGSRPFSAVTLPPIEPPKISYREEVIANSRAQFGAPREKIESAIFAELAEMQAAAEPAPKKAPMRDGPRREGGQGGGQSGQGGGYGSQGGNQGGAPRADRPRRQDDNRPSGSPSAERNTAPREQREPRPVREERERPDPQQNTKTAEDLKSILRGMTDGAKKDEGKKGTKEEAPPLKGALADVLSRSDMKPASAVPAAEPAPKPKAEK